MKNKVTELSLFETETINGGLHWFICSVAFAIAWDTLNDLEGTSGAISAGRDSALNLF